MKSVPAASNSYVCVFLCIPFLFRNEFQKSVVEQDWLNDNFEKTVGKTNKMAVENHEEKFESKQVKLETKTNFNHGPKIWHCSGGNGSDTPAKNEPTLKETKLGNRATTFPCDRCENNDGGFGGDDNDPSRTTPKLMKGHYVESAFPLKNKDTGMHIFITIIQKYILAMVMPPFFKK